MDLVTLTETLLKNRGISPELAEGFFEPPLPETFASPFDSLPAIQLIKQHIANNNKIAIYGDYDVDGICSTAILWETLYPESKLVFPHIPHRESEGYGLSQKGIDHCLAQGAKLIIAVDNGIVAHKEVDYSRSKGCDIIIIDHHELGETPPPANVVLHSVTSCAAGLTWLFCRDYSGQSNTLQLDLTAIAVICDIVQLVGLNRSFAKHGLGVLNTTTRPGLLALLEKASLQLGNLGTYEVGFVIGPRLNAMGRLEHAIDSLRLLCTKSPQQAQGLAQLLHDTNAARQELTTSAVNHALSHVNLDNSVLVAADPSYQPGIIGLIAAKLTEKYYRPSIAIAIGEQESKASARSIQGFHVTDHIRKSNHLLTNAGGHAMAAGFTVESAKLPELLPLLASAEIPAELLVRKTRVDAEIPLEIVNTKLYDLVQKFAPFGLGNPQPAFVSKNIQIDSAKRVGKLSQHAKLHIGSLEAMAFNTADIPENPVDITYTIDENTWNGNTRLQLIVKSIQSFR